MTPPTEDREQPAAGPSTAGPSTAGPAPSEWEERPKLIIGLGNPGQQYQSTRHNVGFQVIEEIARRRSWSLDREQCACLTAGDHRLVLAQPQTYMNRSGYAARCLSELHSFEPPAMLVVFDEVHLPLGKLRLRRKGSPGGHRGLESIVENLRSQQMPRLRLGVGRSIEELGEDAETQDTAPEGEDLVTYVLGEFEADEHDAVNAMIQRAADACELWLAEGVETAMNRFNG